TSVRRERRAPLKGEVLVAAGDAVGPDTVVARCELPGNVQTVNLAARLAVDPAAVAGTLLRPVGSEVRRGEWIAEARAMFRLMRQRAEAPADGAREGVPGVTGRLLGRGRPTRVEGNAYVGGGVVGVLPGGGGVVESRGAFVQGIFGVGGEPHGALAVAPRGPDEPL